MLAHVQVSELPARELVPGDVVDLHAGDRVPADIRVAALNTATLRAEQASLTGESVAVLKCLEPGTDAACELQAKVRGGWAASCTPGHFPPTRVSECSEWRAGTYRSCPSGCFP